MIKERQDELLAIRKQLLAFVQGNTGGMQQNELLSVHKSLQDLNHALGKSLPMGMYSAESMTRILNKHPQFGLHYEALGDEYACEHCGGLFTKISFNTDQENPDKVWIYHKCNTCGCGYIIQ